MREFIILLVHSIVTLVRLAKPGGLRSVVAESVLVRHQLLILNRGRKRAPNLRARDRIIVGLCTLFMRPARVLRSAIVLKPFHSAASPEGCCVDESTACCFRPVQASAWFAGTGQRIDGCRHGNETT